jgi:lipocalin
MLYLISRTPNSSTETAQECTAWSPESGLELEGDRVVEQLW